jgi:hypothetical protein
MIDMTKVTALFPMRIVTKMIFGVEEIVYSTRRA